LVQQRPPQQIALNFVQSMQNEPSLPHLVLDAAEQKPPTQQPEQEPQVAVRQWPPPQTSVLGQGAQALPVPQMRLVWLQ